MRRLIEISKTGLTAVLLNRTRSAVTVFALLVILVPYLTGVGLSHGIQEDAAVSVRIGGDLYVTGNQFGRNTPIPVSLASQIRELEGVTSVTPRIVGRLTLGREQVEAVAVGIPAAAFPDAVQCIDGRLPKSSSTNEFVVGTSLARRLKLKNGSLLPPFYRNPAGEHVSKIVGVFESDVSLWQSTLMFSTLETAQKIFNLEGMATDLVVHCQPGYDRNVSSAILRTVSSAAGGPESAIPVTVTTRQQLNLLLAASGSHRDGVFNLHFVLAFAVGILAVFVTSGFGRSERRHETGLLKATGWQTDEILLRSFVENLILSIAGAAFSILFTFLWLKLFNGYWIASIFIHGLSIDPSFPLPFRLAPVPAMLAFVIAISITMCGSLWSTWRNAIVPPEEAMR